MDSVSINLLVQEYQCHYEEKTMYAFYAEWQLLVPPAI